MKKLQALTLAALLLGGGASSMNAQDLNRDFYPHGFIGLQGGVSTTFFDGDHDCAPAGAFQFGGYHTPVWGLRGKIYGWKNKYNSDKLGQKLTYKYVTTSVDVLSNLSNLIAPKNTCPLDLIAFAGVGVGFNKVSSVPYDGSATFLPEPKTNIGLHCNAGLQLDWRLSRLFDLNLEVAGHYLGGRIGKYSGGLGDWNMTTMLGVVCKLNNKKGHVSYNSSANAMQSYYNNQDAQMAAAGNPNAKAQQELVATPKPQPQPQPQPKTQNQPVQVTTKTVKTQTAKTVNTINEEVFYTIGSASIRPAEMQKIKNLAEWLKQYPDAQITIVGYADAGTGTSDINMKVAEKRVHHLAKVLQQKYGISADRIAIEAKGDSVQPFADNDKNRVVIIAGKSVK